MCDRSQLAARIDVRSSREFYDTLRGAAKRAQLSVSDYTRLALSERMAIDALGTAVFAEHEAQRNEDHHGDR